MIFLPPTAPTAPKLPWPSMILASHSTVPAMLRFEPRPALVWSLLCLSSHRINESIRTQLWECYPLTSRMAMAKAVASVAERPLLKLIIACEKKISPVLSFPNLRHSFTCLQASWQRALSSLLLASLWNPAPKIPGIKLLFHQRSKSSHQSILNGFNKHYKNVMVAGVN